MVWPVSAQNTSGQSLHRTHLVSLYTEHILSVSTQNTSGQSLHRTHLVSLYTEHIWSVSTQSTSCQSLHRTHLVSLYTEHIWSVSTQNRTHPPVLLCVNRYNADIMAKCIPLAQEMYRSSEDLKDTTTFIKTSSRIICD